ncbi:MAG: hypothetical protein ACMUJM_19375 [bacterium]
MIYVLLIHIGIAIYILIDGVKRKANTITWAVGATVVGPIILPEYMRSWSYGRRSKFLKYLAIFWTLLLIVAGIWSQKSTTSVIKGETLEYKLALLNGCGSVQENDMEIGHFRNLLDQLSQNYMEDRQQIANMSVVARQTMKKSGIEVSLVNIMEGLNSLFFPQNIKSPRYAHYVLAYANWRKEGFSHQETVEKLQAMISGY